EFFESSAPHIATAVSAATRRRYIEELEKENPELYRLYKQAKDSAEKTLEHVRTCERFPLTGQGDINTYAVFAELAYSIVASHGRVGLLVPSGIATDHTTKEFFGGLVSEKRLIAIYDFENKAPIFPDVHRSFKITILLFGGKDTKAVSSDFVFFAHTMADLEDKNRHIALTPADFKLFNPNTLTCPIFRSKRDAELTKAIYRRVPVLVDNTRKEGGNPWGIKFLRMFDQTNDAELFHTADKLKVEGFKRDGSCWKKGKARFLPLYEAKMIQMYDHRAASVVVTEENWMRQGQTADTSQVQHQNPEFVVDPRWWIHADEVRKLLESAEADGFVAYKDVTSSTNQRTMISAFIPFAGVLNSAPLMLHDKPISVRARSCLLANLNSIPFDFVARQKVGGLHLNFFIVEQLPVFAPDYYTARCPWEKRTTLEKWVSDRVLKLSCTSNDMIPLAEAAGFDPPVHKWNPEERADLMAQLDAAYFLMYGIKRDDVEYILSTFNGINGSGDTFFGGMGTTDRILKYYDKFAETAGHSD
ncbi:MAG: hypothetical protein PHR28_03115, partial [candidate division Zixibacteria bacterium]|nr:hypothetical protein [candidate division Zixibacteria bacterium]